MLPAGNGYGIPLAGVYGHMHGAQPRFSRHAGPQARKYHRPFSLQLLWLPGQTHSLLSVL